jgi:hypothetical protein
MPDFDLKCYGMLFEVWFLKGGGGGGGGWLVFFTVLSKSFLASLAS